MDLIEFAFSVIMQVPSGYDERVVGYECPEVHQLFWFNMSKGPLHYVPSIDKDFKLVDAAGGVQTNNA